ncbi:MAG: phosphoribosylglycinamide formyltransferase [Clostridiales bacterium]|nr:phosphoribosylglycinamide formyltransferase [Clostridiales bacterium]
MKNIGVLISGGGTNLQALIDKQGSVIKSGRIVCVCSNSAGAYGLERAKKAGVPTKVIRKNADCGGDVLEFNRRICEYMKEMKVDVIVLAGFLAILGGELLSEYAGRIINIHPSLIPSFCGDGFYGLKVHEAVLSYGVKVTGATAHLVNEITDGGRILLQKAVYIKDGDTPEILQKRVMEQAEWIILPEAVEMVCAGKV